MTIDQQMNLMACLLYVVITAAMIERFPGELTPQDKAWLRGLRIAA